MLDVPYDSRDRGRNSPLLGGVMGETLLTAVTCQPEPRHFLWWNWTRGTHNWVELDRWKTPLHYGTLFHIKRQCTKCWEERVETVEAYGP